MAGYTVELALKDRICRTLRWSGFPQTSGEFQRYQSYKIRSLEVLLSLTGVEARIKARHFKDWSIVPLARGGVGLEEFLDTYPVEHGAVEVWNREFFGIEVRHAYIITAQRVGAGAEAVAA